MMRRTVAAAMLVAAIVAVALSSSGKADSPVAAPPAAAVADPDRAVQRLMGGNERFVAGKRMVPDEPKRRQELAQSQKPIAVVVSCSDSRVPPEIVFDQDLGDLFVVRTAGNVVGDLELGSIEYAVEHLGTPLIVVLGHQRCGAVTAAVKGGEAEGHIAAIVKAIAPAVAESKGQSGDAVDNAIRANVRDLVRQLRTSEPVLSHFAHDGKLKIVGGRYDLDTGKVELLAGDESKHD